MFTITIDEDRAEQILKAASLYYDEAMMGVDLGFLLGRIKQYYPVLWGRYSYLEDLF